MQKAVTAGGISVILLTLAPGAMDPRRGRLGAVAEETLLALLDRGDSGAHRHRRITAASSGRGAELEFITGPSDAENLEDRFAMLEEPPPEVEGIPAGAIRQCAC